MAKPTYPGTGDKTPAARAQRETYWRRLVERWRASGQPKSVFCEREGVSDASLHWWLREIARRDGRGRARVASPATRKAGKPKFVPLRVVTSAAPEPQPFELVVAGQVVRVPARFDPDALRRLIAALEGRAC
jgi:hypothetical protein